MGIDWGVPLWRNPMGQAPRLAEALTMDPSFPGGRYGYSPGIGSVMRDIT